MAEGERVEIRRTREEILTLAARFADAIGSPLRTALERNLERLIALNGPRIARMEQGVLDALRARTSDAADRSVADVVDRLRSPDLWLAPTITFAGPGRDHQGWDPEIPGWLAGLLRWLGRGSRAHDPALGGLEDPPNRVWVTILNAADPLDPILVEFGFEPAAVPDAGGGRFGLQPRTSAELDPSGRLERLWSEYRALYERFHWLTTEGHRAASGARAVRRWRAAGRRRAGG